MRKIDNIVGKKYAFLTVIAEPHFKETITPSRKGHRPYVYCKCDCGETKEVDAYHILSGKVISCGCKWGGHVTHGLTNHRLYNVWEGIKARCNNPNYNQYKDYGGRGIKICDEWANDASVFIKWGIANGWRKGLTIERVDNDGNYEPSNCKWVTWIEQGKNRRNTRKLTYMGRTLRIEEWAKELGFCHGTINDRIYNRKWSVDRALSVPPVKGRNQYT